MRLHLRRQHKRFERTLKKKHRRTCRAVQRSLAMVARTGFAPAVSSLREERGTRDRRRETPLPNSRGESGRAVSRTTSASFVTWGGVQQWCWGWCDDRYSKWRRLVSSWWFLQEMNDHQIDLPSPSAAAGVWWVEEAADKFRMDFGAGPLPNKPTYPSMTLALLRWAAWTASNVSRGADQVGVHGGVRTSHIGVFPRVSFPARARRCCSWSPAHLQWRAAGETRANYLARLVWQGYSR